MIILAIVTLAKHGRHDKEVPHFNVLALPNLFGGTVYSFMCHHSLPSIVTPMRDKSRVLRIVGMAFMSVIVVYLFLFISCGLAFGM
jgi:amino acid permease